LEKTLRLIIPSSFASLRLFGRFSTKKWLDKKKCSC
jgi:hypothetical protein